MVETCMTLRWKVENQTSIRKSPLCAFRVGLQSTLSPTILEVENAHFGNSSSRVLFSTSKIRNSTACGHPRCFLQIWDFAVWPWSTAPTCCPSTYLAARLCFTVKDMCWDALTHDSSWDQSSQLFLSISINTTVPIWFSLGAWTRIYKAKIKCSPPTSGDERALDRTTFFF